MKKLASGHGEYTMIEEKDQAVNMFRRFRGPTNHEGGHTMQQMLLIDSFPHLSCVC